MAASAVTGWAVREYLAAPGADGVHSAVGAGRATPAGSHAEARARRVRRQRDEAEARFRLSYDEWMGRRSWPPSNGGPRCQVGHIKFLTTKLGMYEISNVN